MKWNRRDFIAKPLTWLAASSVLGSLDWLHAETFPAGEVIHRTLGKTGISLPVVSMGVMNANMPAVVRRAYEVGIRHFDTAAGYQNGRNEEMLGSVIKELGVRDKVTVATKIHMKSANLHDATLQADMRAIFEGSLRRLQMDHVDIVYFHAIDTAEAAGLEAPMELFAALKKEGKARFIGVSTHSGAEQVVNEVTKHGIYDVALVAFNYTMAQDKGLQDALARAASKGVGLVAMKTQAGGAAKPDPKLPQSPASYSQTALLKWVLQNPFFTTAIPGFTNFEQLEQNFSVARNLAYTPAEKDFLGDKTFRASAEFCQQCSKCRADCPQQVDIPTLMRSHMYAVQYSNHGLARDTLASIGAGHGLDACAACGSCKANCRETVNIARKIADLKQITSAGLLRV